MRCIGATVGAVSLFVGSFAIAQTAELSRVGTWKLNIEESHHELGDPLPRESTIRVAQDEDQNLQFFQNWTTAAGEKKSVAFDGEYGGTMFPAGQGQTMAFWRSSDNKFRDAGQHTDFSWAETCSFSADGMKLRCEGIDIDKAENSYPYVEIWDRAAGGPN